MMTLMEHLESFNREERFFLVGTALGNPDFQLSTDFQTKLNTAFGIQPPNSAFVAMDYHLDWLHASPFPALQAHRTKALIQPFRPTVLWSVAAVAGDVHQQQHLALVVGQGLFRTIEALHGEIVEACHSSTPSVIRPA